MAGCLMQTVRGGQRIGELLVGKRIKHIPASWSGRMGTLNMAYIMASRIARKAGRMAPVRIGIIQMMSTAVGGGMPMVPAGCINARRATEGCTGAGTAVSMPSPRPGSGPGPGAAAARGTPMTLVC